MKRQQRPDATSKHTQPAAAPTPTAAPPPHPLNYFAGLTAFIHRWDNAEDARRTAAATPPRDTLFKTSPQGNINATGSPYCPQSAIFDRHHPFFRDSLEPGVRDLVIQLIERLDCITYSSCEGHPGVGSAQEGFSLREVGIVARNKGEHQRLRAALDALAQTTNTADTAATVRVVVRAGVLRSEQGGQPCIDLVFVGGTDDADVYFRDVEAVSQTFLRALEASTQVTSN